VHIHLRLIADAHLAGSEYEPLARVPVEVRVLVKGGRRPGFDARTAQREHGVPARLDLEDEGDRPFEVMEEFTAHAKPPNARGGVDHDPHCTAESTRVNRPGCTIGGSTACAR